MTDTSQIPEKLHDEMFELSAEGKSIEQIRQHLNTKYNIDASYISVQKKLHKIKEERKAIAQAAYAKAVAKSANKDLSIMDKVIDRFFEKIEQCLEQDDLYNAKHLADTLYKYQAKRLELSGIKDANNADGSHVRIQKQLDILKRFEQMQSAPKPIILPLPPRTEEYDKKDDNKSN